MHRSPLTALCVVFVASVASAQETPQQRVEAIRSARHEFTIRLAGTVDGETTRDPITYRAWNQGFEPMRSVRLENTGATDLVNPWVLVNGRRNWRTTGDIAQDALRSYGEPSAMSDAEKARAIWDFQRHHRFHATTGDLEVRDPVKMFNVYGYSLCGDNAMVLADLWRSVGLKTRRGFPMGHCVAEVWYEGAWHMMDADGSVVFLDRDNRTIMAEKKVAGDHDLAKRSYPGDVLPALYTYNGGHGGDFPSHADHTMALTLRPGEAIEWRWDNRGKHHHSTLPSLFTLDATELSRWGAKAWATLRNGTWSYRPDLRKPAAGRGAEADNVRWSANGRLPAASAANPSQPASLTWKVEAPYVMVGGKVSARGRGVVFSLSRDGKTWAEAGRLDAGEIRQDLDSHFPSAGPAVYRYFLRAEWTGGAAGLDSIAIENDLQMAPLSLPALSVGENRILYTDETVGDRSVRLTFAWVENTTARLPAAPAGPVEPADGAAVEGTGFTLAWPVDEGAADYHFQLSDDPRFRWALSPAFDTMLSDTPSKGKPRFTIPGTGLLNPGERYYWRVRAKSTAAAWGPWSKTWSFVPQAPGVPLNVRLEESAPNVYTLQWDANPAGRNPASYKVYASDEKGFSASDTPYRAGTGNQKSRGLFPGEKSRIFPANLLGETGETSLTVEPRHAFYRVVSIDAKGNRSGSSAYAAATRPFIYSKPPLEARTGAPFRYEAKTIASNGDLTFRDFGPGQSYQSAYWDADQPRYSLEPELPRCGNFDPKWLRIDPLTGVLSGTPGAEEAGEYQVNIRVDIPSAGSYVQTFPLRVTK